MLPPDEWHRLVGTEAETAWPHFGSTAEVVVVESGADIVGCWVALPVAHVECLWIAPAYRRRVSVGRRLWRGMRAVLHRWGAERAWTVAVTADVRQMLGGVGGQRVPGDHYVVPFRKRG